MAIYGRLLRDKAAADHEYAASLRSMKSGRDMVAVPYERLINQTIKAIRFPSYGWVPKVAIQWRKANGVVVPWMLGHEGDTLMIAREFVPVAKVGS